MQAAVSQTVDLGKASRRTNPGRGRPAARGSSADVAVDLPTTTHADLALVREALEEITPRARSESLGRAINVVIAAVAMVLMAPVFALIALAIRLTSRGPVLYSQTRVGVDRRWRQ